MDVAVGIERERLEEAVVIIREVIFGLRNVRQENAEAVGERGVVVLVLLDGLPQFSHDFVGFGPILGSCGTQLGHVHVRAHLVMVHVAHCVHGAMLGLLIFLA